MSGGGVVSWGRRAVASAAGRLDLALAVIGLLITQVRIHRADDAWPYAPLLLGMIVAVAPALIAVRRVVPILASLGLATAALLSLLLSQTDWVLLAGCGLALWSVARRCSLGPALATLLMVTLLPLLAAGQWWRFYSTAYRQVQDSGVDPDGTRWSVAGIPPEMLERVAAMRWSWWLSAGLAAVWLVGLTFDRWRRDAGSSGRRSMGEQVDDLWAFLTARRNRLGIDLIVAVAASSVVLADIRLVNLVDGTWWTAPEWLRMSVAYSPMVLVLQRIRPVVPCVWLALTSVVSYWQVHEFWALLVAFAVALYTLAALRPLRMAVPVAAGILGLLPVLSALAGERLLTSLFPILRSDVGDFMIPYYGSRYGWEYRRLAERDWPVSLSLVMALPVCLGVLVRLAARINESREREATLRRQAERQDTRAKVARDLHDVIAHHVNLMVIQAEDGLDLVPRERTDLAVRLERIGDAGRLALAELDRTLAALRNPDGRADPELMPQPELGDLRRLVADLDRPELAVELDLRGDLDRVPAGHQVTGYRLVQEALTNVVRHARATRAAVVITGDDNGMRIRVTDDGAGFRSADASSAGRHGLAGMRERVRIHDGTLTVESAPGAGTTISAWIPR